jgi:uncharacterized protein YbaR (Trm112 family)
LKSEETRKALGKKSRDQKRDNMIKVFLTIAKEPSSFPELVEKTRLSKSTLFGHLEYLEKKAHAIYRDTIKEDQTLNSEEIGKLVYHVKIDEIPNMLQEGLSLLGILVDPFEDKELDRQLEEHKRKISRLLTHYIDQLRINREQALKLEIENLKKEQSIDRSRKKRES